MREIRFLIALWRANLLAAMEYRAAFLTQIFGMMLNNGVYFLFWILFFERFKEIRGWEIDDMFLLFAVVATSFGIGVYFFGNVTFLADIIAEGRLDYYLSQPRPVLLHSLASRSISSGMGDILYGLMSFLFAGQITLDGIGRFGLGVLFGTMVFVSFQVLVQSLAFWMGSASQLARQARNAFVSFALYPISLFDGSAKLILFTLIPAALIGSVPTELIEAFPGPGWGCWPVYPHFFWFSQSLFFTEGCGIMRVEVPYRFRVDHAHPALYHFNWTQCRTSRGLRFGDDRGPVFSGLPKPGSGCVFWEHSECNCEFAPDNRRNWFLFGSLNKSRNWWFVCCSAPKRSLADTGSSRDWWRRLGRNGQHPWWIV